MSDVKTTHLPVAIRPICRADLTRIATIEAASFAYPNSLSEIHEQLMAPDCFCTVAEFEGAVQAYLIWRASFITLEACFWIETLAVAAPYRRRQLGTILASSLLKIQHTLPKTVVTAHVWEQNLPAQQFFASRGFYAVECIDGEYASTGVEGQAIKLEYRPGLRQPPAFRRNRVRHLLEGRGDA